MRRLNPPFNGKQFVLNKNTGEIHNLDNETSHCRIDAISPEHIYTGDSYMSCLLYAQMSHCAEPDGCFYCQPEKDKG